MKRSSETLRYFQDLMPARRELLESGRVRVEKPEERKKPTPQPTPKTGSKK